jgi:signal peptidase II
MNSMQLSPEHLKPNRNGLIAYAIAAVVVVVDQISKIWFLGLGLQEGDSIPVLPIFRLSMVWNPGISFGLLQGHGQIGRWLLVVFAIGVVGGLAWWIRRADRLWAAVAIGLIMGGAIGNNLIDRVRLGMVADFLDFSGLGFKWVFNVADAAINVGIAVLLIDIFLSARQPAAPPAAPPKAPTAP